MDTKEIEECRDSFNAKDGALAIGVETYKTHIDALLAALREREEQARQEIVDIAKGIIPTVQNPIFDALTVVRAFKGVLWDTLREREESLVYWKKQWTLEQTRGDMAEGEIAALRREVVRLLGIIERIGNKICVPEGETGAALAEGKKISTHEELELMKFRRGDPWFPKGADNGTLGPED